jgi:hypothetical protein
LVDVDLIYADFTRQGRLQASDGFE